MLWRPSASIDALIQRAQLLNKTRKFFNQQGYLEVETPVMAQHGVTDVYLSNIKAFFQKKPYYLQTSPEYHMKRLLAAGSGAIYQLARVFRDDELGRWHNPEFTLLEWYQLDIDHYQLMDEVDLFLQNVLSCPPMIRKTFQDAFCEICNLDPFSTSLSQLQEKLNYFEIGNVLKDQETDIDQYLFLLMAHVIEPSLKDWSAPVALYNFPPSQASLAVINNGVAERFEVYFKGVELANGFHELTDAPIQAERFQQDLRKRREKGLDETIPDSFLLQALHHGLPTCSGVALGFDRLFALKLNAPDLSHTLAFDFSRA